MLNDDISNKKADDKIEAFRSIIEHKNDDGVKEKFIAYFEFFKETYNAHRDCLRKGMILQSLSEMTSDRMLPDYPFTPEYAKEWRKENARNLNNNPGSMIIDSDAPDKLSWKRVMRIDLTNQHNDKPVYRRLIKTVLTQALNSEGSDCVEKWKALVNKKLEEQNTDFASPITENVSNALLEWCREDSWNRYYHQGIRLYENGQLYLLKGDAAKLSKDYQELHMMFFLPRIQEKYANACYSEYGNLVIPQENSKESIVLRYDGCVKGFRWRNGDSKSVAEHMCEYNLERILNLIQQLQTIPSADTVL